MDTMSIILLNTGAVLAIVLPVAYYYQKSKGRKRADITPVEPPPKSEVKIPQVRIAEPYHIRDWVEKNLDKIKAIYEEGTGDLGELTADLASKVTEVILRDKNYLTSVTTGYLRARVFKGMGGEWVVIFKPEIFPASYRDSPFPKVLSLIKKDFEVVSEYRLENILANHVFTWANTSDNLLAKYFFHKLGETFKVSPSHLELDFVYRLAEPEVPCEVGRLVALPNEESDSSLYGSLPGKKHSFRMETFLVEAERLRLARESWVVDYVTSPFMDLEGTARYMIECGDAGNRIKLRNECEVKFYPDYIEVTLTVDEKMQTLFSELDLSQRGMGLCMAKIVAILNDFLSKANTSDNGEFPGVEQPKADILFTAYHGGDISLPKPCVFKLPIIPIESKS